jgi:glycosyltransferase involved in cell wall biosynthesis
VAEEGVLKRRSASALPKYLLVTSARNEEQLLEQTIRAVLAQTVRPVKWIIVNDGSTDSTAKIIDRYAASLGWIERLEMPTHRDRNFAAKAYCFNAGWKAADGLDYDVIGNLDADITFEADYFEFLLTKFAEIRSLSAFYSLGEKDYCLGGSPAWEVCRVAYRMSKRPLFLGGSC